jgi:hypothetical protein
VHESQGPWSLAATPKSANLADPPLSSKMLSALKLFLEEKKNHAKRLTLKKKKKM